MTTATVSFLVVAKRTYGTGRIFVKHDAYYGSWRLSDGRRTTRKLGPIRHGRTGLTKADAEAALREMMLADNGGNASRDGRAPTVEQMGEVLIARMERDRRKLSHVETCRGHLRKHIDPFLGDMLVTDVSETHVDQLVNRMLRAGLAPKTVRNVVGTLHSLLERATKDRFITQNPAHMAELPRVPKSRELRFLTLDELERVIAAEPPADDAGIAEHFPVGAKYGGPQAVRDWWPVVRVLVLTAAMTGMRLGELRALRWRDVGARVRVRESFVRGVFDDPKSELSSRAIPLAARVVTELDAHHRSTPWNQESDLVFAHPHTGRPLDRVRLGHHYKAALKRADVRPIRIHDLRHTFATTMAAAGVPLRTLQAWMGHEDSRTTQIYAAYAPAEHEAQLIDDAFTRRTPIGLQDSPTLPNTNAPEPR